MPCFVERTLSKAKAAAMLLREAIDIIWENRRYITLI